MKIFCMEIKWEVWTGYDWFMIGLSGVFLQIWYSPFRLCKRQILQLLDIHYILKKKSGLWSLFVNNVFDMI